MKKLLLICGLLWSAVTSAQFVPGQVLTAAELNSQFALYAPLSGATFTGTVTAPVVVINSGTDNAQFNLITSSPTGPEIQFFNNSGTNSYGFYNFTTFNSGLSFSLITDQATFFSRPVFGTATPWDNANLASPASTVSPTFTGNVAVSTLSATGSITPSQTAGIVGTTTNNNAAAGSVGEFPTPTNLSAVPLANNIAITTSSVTLSAGDWDVQCVNEYTPAGTTIVGTMWAGISTTANTMGAVGTYQRSTNNGSNAAGNAGDMLSPTVRELLSTSTTVYCIGQSFFSVSTATVAGFLRARRIR